ncbi:hypothetical protein BpHYR1_044080 [Brachionus plicatilis]|uniref:Uncharacterized protein n=1 Tax=Brachionus plicatilis TaxID=10195 RepID=A0A3M7QP62_BRAPC|nr:hypothetical protein BpHYR1_044080 [Brachionus plicatilis]
MFFVGGIMFKFISSSSLSGSELKYYSRFYLFCNNSRKNLFKVRMNLLANCMQVISRYGTQNQDLT